MAIYRRYTRAKPSEFRKQSEEAYSKFIDELRRLESEGITLITTDTLSMLIARHTFKLGRGWNRKARQHYFKYFIKRAEKAGLIRFIGRHGVWEINASLCYPKVR